MEPKTGKLTHYLTGFYLSKQATGLSPNALREYQQDFAHLARWCDGRDCCDPTKLTTTNLKAFLAYLRGQPNGHGDTLSPKTVYNVWVALKSFLKWLSEEADIPNPMAKVPAPKAPTAVIEPLTREQVEAILKACDGTRQSRTVGRRVFTMKRDCSVRDRAIVMLLLDSSLRAGELCKLTIADVDMATGRILVRSGKGGKGIDAEVATNLAGGTVGIEHLDRRDVSRLTPNPDMLIKLCISTGCPIQDEIWIEAQPEIAVFGIHWYASYHASDRNFSDTLRSTANLSFLSDERALGRAFRSSEAASDPSAFWSTLLPGLLRRGLVHADLRDALISRGRRLIRRGLVTIAAEQGMQRGCNAARPRTQRAHASRPHKPG